MLTQHHVITQACIVAGQCCDLHVGAEGNFANRSSFLPRHEVLSCVSKLFRATPPVSWITKQRDPHIQATVAYGMTNPAISSAILESVSVGGVGSDAQHLAPHVAAVPSPSLDAVSIKVGDLFPDMKSFRARLGLYGITHKCPYRARRSDNSRFVGICPAVMNDLKKEWGKGKNKAPHDEPAALNEHAIPCPFHVIARRRKEGGVCVTRAILMHSPDCTAPVSFSTSATSAYMSQLMEESASTIAPREIGKFVHEATGTKLSYSTLWRTSHMLQSKERERLDASFKKIVPFLNAFREANANTTAVVEQHANGRFYRAFLCPGALGHALADCPFALHVESMPITSCYEGFVLAAYVKDGLGAPLPLAIAITPRADEDNWRFLFHQLLSALPIVGCSGIAISHDKDLAIHEAQLSVLPASQSVLQFTHFDWTASGTLQEYYNQMSNLCASSYFSIIVGWVTQVAVLMYARYVELESERSVFPGELLGRGNVHFDGWDVASFGPSDYLVVNPHEKQQVNLAIRTCTCGQWADHAFPCIHAIRCLPLERLVSLGQFIHPSYFTESVRRCYSRRMTLINTSTLVGQGETLPNTAAFMSEHNTAAGSVTMPTELPLLPPSGTEPVKRGRGRPRVVRSNNHRGSGLGAMYQCGHCNGKGHNSRTCPMNQKPEVAVPPTTAQITAVALGGPSTESAPNMFADATVPFTIDSSLSTSQTPV